MPPPHPQSPRQAALTGLTRWSAETTHIEDILASLELSSQCHSTSLHLTYGVLRNLRALDSLISYLRPDGALKERPRNVLRLGLYESLFMDTPPHAVVSSWVDAAGPAKSLVNAILRRATREPQVLRDLIQTLAPPIRLSHPDFLFDRWREAWGDELALGLMAWDQDPAPLYLRANPFVPHAPARLVEAGGQALSLPGFYHFSALPRQILLEGLAYAQDPATRLAPELLDPRPGQRVLDACAAPGGKSALLASLSEGGAHMVAADASPRRLRRLRENLRRLRIPNASAVLWDATLPPDPSWSADGFDAILLDVPCSNTGVLRRRVDARWRLTPDSFVTMAKIQSQIIANAIPLLRPGASLVYSTCSLEVEENRQIVDQALAENPSLTLEEESASHPAIDGFDGAYAARLRSR
jgi:16S rRNA (cytosine967-C5)-methyltransferase